ncbi:hypothetical protein EV651_112182 [Kribbella sp. VKM Ac-2571]|uniref:hypothetical protein n=1 Tax=Kribbella sp. VKM Ac-2571 TaxID=2512222 RepID=UPI00105C0611|nr:hypothetical protein [Kribbella sp. VKM Ac-2571]TDO56795.1 hypothetical protein EV651_112182 [Kribbella sp. VKM Ac-2571]
MNRNLGITGLIGAAVTTLTGLAVEVVVKPASEISDKLWSYPWSADAFVPVSIVYAVLHLLVFLGMVAVFRAMTTRAGRIGAALAAGGTLVLLLAELASVPIADQRLDDTGPQLVGACFGLGVALTAIGLIVAGVVALRLWTGWQRYAALLAGVWSVVMIGLSMTSALPLGVTIYGITLCVLFAAVLTRRTQAAASNPRIRARIEPRIER